MEIIKKNNYVSPVIVLPNDTDPNEQKYAAWQTLRDNGMTCKQIGEMFGVGTTTVFKHTKTNVELRGKHSGKYVHERAELRRAYYVPIMLELRKLGYSNVDIGKKTGFGYGAVLKYIGRQPDETTLASIRSVGAKRHFRFVARKNQPERDAGKPIPAVAKILETA